MPAVERVKLRMKIGVHEFEAEGPSELVLAQAETWMRVAGLPAPPADGWSVGAGNGVPQMPLGARAGHLELGSLFRVDSDRRLLTLRVRVNGRRRNADAALLLLYGFDTCLGAGDGADTPASRLRAALAASGHRLRRVDRVLAPHVQAGLVRKAGSHKHETYALTVPGSRHAAALARHLATLTERGDPVTTAGDRAVSPANPATSAADPGR